MFGEQLEDTCNHSYFIIKCTEQSTDYSMAIGMFTIIN